MSDGVIDGGNDWLDTHPDHAAPRKARVNASKPRRIGLISTTGFFPTVYTNTVPTTIAAPEMMASTQDAGLLMNRLSMSVSLQEERRNTINPGTRPGKHRVQ